MKRAATVTAICLAASWCSYARAASWAESMFSELRHDFGTIARGAEVHCTFVMTNTTETPVVICGMKRTCGCTLITLDDKVVLDESTEKSREKKVVSPGQEAHIGVVLDTRSFVGSKSADITVSFSQPASADVRLTVNSFIRQDVVLNPGAIQFGSLSHGQDATRELEIEYAGQADWQIRSVTNQNPNLDVKCDQIYRMPGRVGYKLTVGLQRSAAPGCIRDMLLVETNDPALPTLPVLVSGQVQADLVVTPSSLSFGTLKAGQPASRQVLIRGKKPFRVTKVDCADARFHVEKSDGALTFHKLTIQFDGSDQSSNIDCNFHIETDLADNPAAELKVSAQVVR